MMTYFQFWPPIWSPVTLDHLFGHLNQSGHQLGHQSIRSSIWSWYMRSPLITFNFLKSETAQDMDNQLPVFSFSLRFFLVPDFWDSLCSLQVFVMMAHLCKWGKTRCMSISLALPALINLCLQLTQIPFKTSEWEMANKLESAPSCGGFFEGVEKLLEVWFSSSHDKSDIGSGLGTNGLFPFFI